VHKKLQELRGKRPAASLRIARLGWLGATAASALGVVLLAGILIRAACPPAPSGSNAGVGATAAGSPGARRPTEEQIHQASIAGPEAIEELVQQFPRDPELLEVLGRSYLEANAATEAVSAYRSLLAVDPAALDDPLVSENIELLCKTEPSSAAAFAMLESHGGSRGAELLYGLAYESKAEKKYQLRAEYALRKQVVRRRGSPALQIALDLRATGGRSWCSGRCWTTRDAAGSGWSTAWSACIAIPCSPTPSRRSKSAKDRRPTLRRGRPSRRAAAAQVAA
jgi:hypothetical protein